MVKKYAVHPGKVRSRTDGDVHDVGFLQLARLYGVDPNECVEANEQNSEFIRKQEPPLIHLFTHYDGNYKLPFSVSHRCCPEFERALHSASDNEGYEPLVFPDADDGMIKIGSDLPPIRFCPWCSAPVKQPQ